MKRITKILSCFVVIATMATNVFAQNPAEIEKYNSGSAEYYKMIRANQVSGIVSPENVQDAHKKANQLSQSKGIDWIEIGPNNYGGRTRSIIVDRNNPSVIYAGSVAGGLWKSEYRGSSWTQAYPSSENNAITCITQDINGIIYFGTGEGYITPEGSANSCSSFDGNGLFKSTDATGTNFVKIETTTPENHNSDWIYTYEMKSDPNSAKIYVCTEGGLKMTTNGGETWENPILYPTTNAYKSISHDVEVASNGAVYAVVGNRAFYSENGSIGSFQALTISDVNPTKTGRLELAVAPSDPNCVYAVAILNTGSLKGIYRSLDAGQNWTLIGPGGSTNFDIFSNFGVINNTITVDPSNKNHIFVASLNLWEWEEGKTWEQKSGYNYSSNSPYFLHQGINKIFFDQTNSNTAYIATDGGISKTINGFETFQQINRNYSTVQFHNIISDCFDNVIGGTQDNGILILSKTNTPNEQNNASQFLNGNCGYGIRSYINPEFQIGCGEFGKAYRSEEAGANTKLFWEGSTAMSEASGSAGFSSFITPILMRENFNETTSTDSVIFVDTLNHAANEVVSTISNTAKYEFNTTLESAYIAGDTIYVKDIIKNRIFVGLDGQVLMSKDIMNFTKNPTWFNISKINGVAQSMAANKDGDILFVGTTQGNFYRISNILAVTDTTTGSADSATCVVKTDLIKNFGRVITSISVDPNNSNNVVVTLGRYGNNQYVYSSKNAMDADVTFTDKTGNLPKMPVYASLVEMTNPNVVFIGTELGVYKTDNINASNPSWVEENTNIGRIPVYSIYQQQANLYGTNNFGAIYIGTHGRGAFQTMEYLKINNESSNIEKTSLNIFPNPAVSYTNIEFTADNNTDAIINIYSIDGKLVQSEKVSANAGYNKFEINVSNLKNANYKIEIRTNENSSIGNFIKM